MSDIPASPATDTGTQAWFNDIFTGTDPADGGAAPGKSGIISGQFVGAGISGGDAVVASPVDLDLIRTELADEPYAMASALHCEYLVNPWINSDVLADNVASIENPALRYPAYALTVPPKILDGIDAFYFHVFNGVGEADRRVNRDGVFHALALDGRDGAVGFTGQWGVRTAEVGLIHYGGNYLVKSWKNPTVAEVAKRMDLVENAELTEKTALYKKLGIENGDVRFRDLTAAQKRRLTFASTGNFWGRKGGWAPAAAVLLASSGLISQAQKGIDLIDPDKELIDGKERGYAQLATALGMSVAGAAVLSNSYTRIIAPERAQWPVGARPNHALVGFGVGLAYLGLGAYFDNFSAQQRVLPALEDRSPNAAYWPGNWDTDYLQYHTTSSRAINLAINGYIYTALSTVEFKLANLVKFITGVDSGVTKLTATEMEYVKAAGNPLTRAGRSLRTTFSSLQPGLGGKRRKFMLASILTSLPLGLAISRATGMAQGYTSKEALTGTSMRQFLTVPTAMASTSYYLGQKGYSTNFDKYRLGMMALNFEWESCSKQGEAVYQSVVQMARYYENSETQEEKAELGSAMVNAWLITNGDMSDPLSEKARVAKILGGVGIDPEETVARALGEG